MGRNPWSSKIDFKMSSLDPTGNFDCKTSVNFLLAASKCCQSSFTMTPCAIGGGLESLRRPAMRMPMTRRAVGLKTNKPESVVATRASIAKNQIAERFTLGPSLLNLLLARYSAMSPSFGRVDSKKLIGNQGGVWRTGMSVFFLFVDLRFPNGVAGVAWPLRGLARGAPPAR